MMMMMCSSSSFSHRQIHASTYIGDVLKVDDVFRNNDFMTEDKPLVVFSGAFTATTAITRFLYTQATHTNCSTAFYACFTQSKHLFTQSHQQFLEIITNAFLCFTVSHLLHLCCHI